MEEPTALNELEKAKQLRDDAWEKALEVQRLAVDNKRNNTSMPKSGFGKDELQERSKEAHSLYESVKYVNTLPKPRFGNCPLCGKKLITTSHSWYSCLSPWNHVIKYWTCNECKYKFVIKLPWWILPGSIKTVPYDDNAKIVSRYILTYIWFIPILLVVLTILTAFSPLILLGFIAAKSFNIE